MERIKEKKPVFFMRLKKSKKLQVLFFIVSMGILVAAYSELHTLVHDKKISQCEIIKNNFSWVYQVDNIEIQDKKLVLNGWAFPLGKDAEFDSYEIILLENETGNRFVLNTSYSNRKDVNEYFLCEYDYTASGFQAMISTGKLDLEQYTYEVLLYTVKEKKAYSTGVFYANGEILFVHPDEFEPLQTAGTDLEEITEDGVLRVYRPEIGMYVYQYAGQLYWIAEPWYEFINGDALIQFQMNTTQVDNLPQNRLDNGWYWSNLSFWFQQHRLTDGDYGKYQVAVYSLPTEYSLTKIWTGYHSDGFPNGYVDEQNRTGWIWMNYFRPWYE